MYDEFYGLKEKPFAAAPNPRFLVLMEEHREALATLIYAVDQQEGWALVVGDPGVGKTTLIMALLGELGDRVISAVVTNPKLAPMDFFNQLALELGMDGPFASKGPFLVELGHLINRSRREGKVILVVVDEAQDLSAEMLEELRLLGNHDSSSPRVLNIVLVGQPELVRVLKRAGSRSLLQRMHRSYALKPLSPEATAAYVRRRLQVAGAKQDVFDDQALAAVYEVCHGVPRLINSVCDGALLQGFYQRLPLIGRQVILQAAAEDASLEWLPSEEVLTRPLKEPPATPEAPGPAASAWPEPSSPAPRPRRAEASAQEPAPKPPRPERPSARRQPQPARPGPLARLGAGLSREAPGSLWKRLLVLILVLALGWGGFVGLKKAWPIIKHRFSGPKIVIPAPVKDKQPAGGAKLSDGPPDWGPTLPVPGAQEK